MQNRDQTAFLVTGASSGIGAACALDLAQRSYRVFAGVRSEHDGRQLQQRGSLTPVLIDVVDQASIGAARTTIDRAVGDAGLAGLVNNAGISVGGPLEFVPLADLRRQFDVNVVGQVAVTQAFLPLVRRAGGRIVNIGSACGRVATPFLAPYSMSKYALEAFTDALRRELQPWGIGVSIVEPGVIATPIWNKGLAAARATFDAMPEPAHQLYQQAFASAQAATVALCEAATPAGEVAKAVRHALTAARPRTRYLVGRDARQAARAAWLLPDRMLDRAMRKYVGLDA